MPTLPTPEQQWDEPSVSGASLVALTPYLTTDGYWVFLAPTATIPTGATRGGVVEGTDYNTIQTAVTGRRMRRATSGTVFFR